jgi:DNA polymerase III sliding clamp (beta) subunit (PCNA family)
MNTTTRPEQASLEDVAAGEQGGPHLAARISAVAVKLVYPFIAKDDVRYYLNGINLRPLDDGTTMVVATDGHRYIVVRDPSGFTEKELIVTISKDALKHAASAKHTLDVMSDGSAMISDAGARPLFIQPGNALIDATFPRIERIASVANYKEGIGGAVNPRYLADALAIGKTFGESIRFFTRDADSPLLFMLGGLGDLECFGGIMKLRDVLDALPAWFPAPGEVNSLADV